MLLTVVGALLSAAVLVHVLLGARCPRHRRLPARVRRGAVVVSSVLLALNLWCAVAAPADPVWNAVAVATLLAAGVFGFVAAEHRAPAAAAGQQRRILAVAAHPDDLALACGGTLAKLVAAGHEVRGLVLSRGAEGADDPGAQRSRSATSSLGLAGFHVHGFPDTRLDTVGPEMVRVIEVAVQQFRPDVILTHSAHDQHEDHFAVHRATLRAARDHHSILCFESPSVTRDFDPSVFVDIDGYVDAKVEAALACRDRAGKPRVSAGRVRGTAAFRGAQAKGFNAEAFEPVRLLGSAVGDL